VLHAGLLFGTSTCPRNDALGSGQVGPGADRRRTKVHDHRLAPVADVQELLELNDLDHEVVIGLERELLHAHLGAGLGEHLVHLPNRERYQEMSSV